MSEGKQETKTIFCNCCQWKTNHSLRARYTWFRNLDDGTIVKLTDLTGNVDGICQLQNSIWSCLGCNSVTFEWRFMSKSSDNNEKWEEHDGGYFSTVSAVQPKLFRMLNPELSRLYREVLTCFEKDCLLLCTLGLRALIEGVCGDKGLTGGNLEHKIDSLVKFLPSPNLIEALHAFRFAGNDAAHRLEALTRDDAEIAIEVMEDLLNVLYDLDYKASAMRSGSKRAAFKSVTPGSVQ